MENTVSIVTDTYKLNSLFPKGNVRSFILIPPDFDGTGPLPLFEERKENGKVVEALRKIYSAQK